VPDAMGKLEVVATGSEDKSFVSEIEVKSDNK
jgi:ribosome-associated protein YbcJ (S4-like RNA binding protein)